MEELKVKFCSQCTDSIEQKEIKFFFQKAVIMSLTEEQWVKLEDEDELIEDFCRYLELKRFIVTHENEEGLSLTVPGLYFEGEGDVIVCTDPHSHLPLQILEHVY